MKGDWKETRDGVFTYKDDHPLFWTIFIYWLYSGLIDLTATKYMAGERPGQSSIRSLVDFIGVAFEIVEQKYPVNGWSTGVNSYTKLIFAYILGDKLQSMSFKNAIIDAMIDPDMMPEKVYPSSIRYAFEETAITSVLRKFLVDKTICENDKAHVKATLAVGQHQDFILSLAREQLEFDTYSRRKRYLHFFESRATVCDHYHEHKPGETICIDDDQIADLSDPLAASSGSPEPTTNTTAVEFRAPVKRATVVSTQSVPVVTNGVRGSGKSSSKPDWTKESSRPASRAANPGGTQQNVRSVGVRTGTENSRSRPGPTQESAGDVWEGHSALFANFKRVLGNSNARP